MSAPVHRVALLGLLGSGNVGNDASFETVVAWLRRVLPDASLSCITVAPDEVTRRYGMPAVALSSYQEGTRPRGRRRALAGKSVSRLRDVPRTVGLVGRVDAVVVPGMGVLEESLATRPGGMPFWLLLFAVVCRLRGRPFVLLAVGAEAATNPLTRWMFVRTVNLARHVSYRDEWSADAMRSCGAREPDAVAADLAFAHPSAAHPAPEPGLVVVGTMAYYGPGDDPVRGRAVRARAVDALARLVEDLVAAGDRVVLVGGDAVDVTVAQEVRERAVAAGADGARVTARDLPTFAALDEQMARAEVVVASRFHNLVCAVRLARPVVSLGYAVKSRYLMTEVGLGDLCQDLLDVDGDQLARQLRRARAEGPVLSRRMAAAVAGHAARVDDLLEQVRREVLAARPPVRAE
jgi:polysaccharide pyruvyl transferase WcaK-like protein